MSLCRKRVSMFSQRFRAARPPFTTDFCRAWPGCSTIQLTGKLLYAPFLYLHFLAPQEQALTSLRFASKARRVENFISAPGDGRQRGDGHSLAASGPQYQSKTRCWHPCFLDWDQIPAPAGLTEARPAGAGIVVPSEDAGKPKSIEKQAPGAVSDSYHSPDAAKA